METELHPTHTRKQSLRDLTGIRPGDAVEVRHPGEPQYQGVVETAMPSRKVLWVHENVLGERKMVDLEDCYLLPEPDRRHPLQTGAHRQP